MNKEEKLPSYGELLAENFRLEHNYKVLSNRVDKAIEYLRENELKPVYLDCKLYETEVYKELLEILERGKE